MTLVWLAVALIAGIFIGAVDPMPFLPLLVSTGIIGPLAAVVWRRPRIRLVLLWGVCFVLGLGRAQSIHIHIGPRDAAYYNGRIVTLLGYVNTEPDIRDTGNNYVIAVTGLLEGSKTLPVHGQVEVHTAPSQLLDGGAQVQFTGRLTTPTNTPSIPYRSILANRGIFSEMSFPRIFVTGHISLGLVGIADRIRQWIETSISGALPEPEAIMLIAILVGAHSAQLGSLAPILIQTGLIHLIAISGIKIAIVAGTINAFTRRLLPRAPRLAASVVILLGYWLISGATVAGLRASIMWLLVFMAAYLGRPTYALVSLGLAASIMLWADPRLLWDTGFQLTTVGTAAIVAFSPLLEIVTRRIPGFLAASLNTTVAAQIGVLPIQIASFHTVSPISLLANAIVLPFIPLTMVIGFAVAVFPHFPMVDVAYGLVHMLIVIAEQLHKLSPGKYWPTPASLATAVFYAALVLLAIAAWRLRPSLTRAPKGEWVFGLCIAVVGLGYVVHAPPVKDGMYFVTDGDALIVCHGQSVLIDGGTSGSRLLTGLSKLMPFPNDRLDTVMDTSPDAKNVASLLEVAQHVRIGTVVDPGIEYPSQTYSRWIQWLDSHHISTLAMRPGLLISGRGFVIKALAPDAIYSTPKDGAGVLSIHLGNENFLYVGDASPKEQQDLPFEVSVKTQTIISAVPIESTLARASGYRTLIHPRGGKLVARCP